jgi:hypothetical protein
MPVDVFDGQIMMMMMMMESYCYLLMMINVHDMKEIQK